MDEIVVGRGYRLEPCPFCMYANGRWVYVPNMVKHYREYHSGCYHPGNISSTVLRNMIAEGYLEEVLAFIAAGGLPARKGAMLPRSPLS